MKIKTIISHWEKRVDWRILGSTIFLAIALISLTALHIAYDQVSLTVDGQTYRFRSLAPTVAQVLAEKEIVLENADQVYPEPGTKIKENMEIEVFRSFPVKIATAAGVAEFYTVPRQVREVLAAAKIAYDHDDKILPGLDQVIDSPQEIKVIDVKTRIITEKVVAKSGIEYRKDKSLDRGTQRVIREGRDGLVERQIKIVYENNRERRRFKIAEKVLKPKVNAIIAIGIKPVVRVLETSRGSYRYIEMKIMEATAYSPGPESCGKYAKYGRTYTGKKAGFGVVAVDPKVIPLGTKLYIEGYGNAEAADIGSAIKGNRIDLCFETYREAIMYGRKKIKVYILE